MLSPLLSKNAASKVMPRAGMAQIIEGFDDQS